MCEPPLLGLYVRIRAKDERLNICEVEVFGTDFYKDIQGVMQAYWGKFPETTNLSPLLAKQENYKLRDRTKTTLLNRCRLTASSAGSYTFTLTANVEGEMIVKGSRDANGNLLSLLVGKDRPTASGSVTLDACQFYFVKLITTFSGYENELSVGVQFGRGWYESPISSKKLFWALPGQLNVQLDLNQRHTTTTVPITYPVNVTGVYSIECRGLYCGDCSMAIFLSFAGYIKCVTTSSISVSQKGVVILYAENVSRLPGIKPICMGYKINGNCNSTLKMFDSNISFPNVLSKIGHVVIKPLTLVQCQLKWPSWCEGNNSVKIHGWNNEIDSLNEQKKLHILSSIANLTSIFSYKWIQYHSSVNLTGICMKFIYKINGANTTLAIYFESLTQTPTLVWMLRGNHGDQWHNGKITYWPSEPLSFVIKGETSLLNTTVAIANIKVTTEACTSDVFPIYADSAYVCQSHEFRCSNGECVKASLVCDGDKNCLDGSDEIFCKCLHNQFKCERSGECVDVTKLCDNVHDCADESDEIYCYKNCKPGEYYCPNVVDRRCLWQWR